MSADTVRLWDLARGVLGALPDALTVNKGVLGLALMKPDKIGSIGQLLEKQARANARRVALRFEGRSWTYAELNAWANRYAHALKAQGVKPGDAVALLMENRAEVIACVAAIVKLGAIAGMLNHQQRGDVLAHSLKLTRARVVICGAECVTALDSTPFAPEHDDQHVYMWEGEGRAPAGYRALREEAMRCGTDNLSETAAVKLGAPCFYIFTSGTTGMPKASVMTHYRWLRSGCGMGLMALRLRKDDVYYCPLPLYHNNALTVSWSSALASGCALALGRKFSASRFWDEVRAHRATAFCYIGELCRYLLNQPPQPADREHSIRVICGNGLRAELWDAFQERFGIERICEFYGASEGNLVFVNGFGLSKTAGFCPMSFAIVEFDNELDQPRRDAQGRLIRVGPGSVGLLVTEVSDKNPFDGYTDAAASEAKLLRNGFAEGDCWFNSGDLVRDQGYAHIQFVDRVGDTFRWKGENVATTEVEGALNRAGGIQEAAVYGVQVPNADGRAGMAALTLAAGELDGAGLARHLFQELPPYAVPLFLRLRTQQETTATFKFMKVELKNQGFDPGKVAEPLYVLLDRERGYERLTTETFRRIREGSVRL